jgi:moderate conductance mechanosensitive channel
MVWRISICGILLAFCLSILPAAAQIPGLPKLVGTEAQSADAAVPPADRKADVEALDRIIGLLKDDRQRSDFVGSLERMRAGLVTEGPPAPDAASTLPKEGLIGALATNVTRAVDEFPETALGDPPSVKLQNASAELQERAAANFGGEQTLAFLSWALPGIAVVAGVMTFLFRNRWLLKRRTIRRRVSQTRMQLLRRVSVKLVFDLLPWFGAVVAIAVWTTAFSPSWRDTQIFLALTTPFVLPALVRQLVGFGLLLLARTRGWKLVNYARLKLLPWVAILTSAGVAAGLMREFAVRLVIGRNVADIVALLLDLLAAGLTILFVLRHRRTVRSLIVKGRRRRAEGDHGTGVLATVVTAFGNFWHIFAVLFVIANVGARLFGIGGGNFFEDALFAVIFILAGLFFLAFANETFTKWREQLGRSRTTARSALTRRYLGLLHIVLQIATTVVVAIACIDLWGFQIAEWLTTASGSQVLRPALSIVLVPLVVWLIWITVDTLIEHALNPVDNFGRQRQQSARIKTLLPLLRNFIFAALSIVTVIAVLANVGVNVAPLLAGAGIIGIAISFGSQQLVQDVITGFFFLFEDALAIGDTISTGTQAGVVEGINIRTVKIRAGDGALYSVPFSQIKALQNSSRGYGIFQIAVTVGFGSDADRALDVMRDIGAELKNDPKYKYDMLAPIEVWGVDGFSPDGVVLKGAIRCRPLQQWGVGREFNRRLKRRFDEEGIVLFRPKQVIEIAGESRDAERGREEPPPVRAGNGAVPHPA